MVPCHTMQEHINSVSHACYYQLRNIANNKHYLTLDTTKTLVHALVCSRIDSLNALYFGLPDNIIHKLQVIQNNAARVIAPKKETRPHNRNSLQLTLAADKISNRLQNKPINI